MKITPEIIEQINILYLEIGVKKKVSEIIGCSPATVSKYIDPNFVASPPSADVKFEGIIGNADWFVDSLKTIDNKGRRICELCMLSDEEKEELKELQKEIRV